jgi:hypothetical protein
MAKMGRRLRLATILVLLSAAAGSALGVAVWRDWQRRSNEAWLDEVSGLTATERLSVLKLGESQQDRPAIVAALKGWDLCVARYQRDGAADARSDFNHRTARPYWGHNGGNVEVEWVPGLESFCAPPLPPTAGYPSRDEWSRRGNFRELDQMGSESEDGQWRTGLADRCERTSRIYAASYNRELAKLDVRAFRQCRPVSVNKRNLYPY